MGKKHKNVCRIFNYIEQLLILNSTVASLLCNPIAITSSAVGVRYY